MTSKRKVAFVTGGGSGIGRVTAFELQKAGFNVVIIGRRLEPLQETIDLGMKDGPEMLAISADVGEPDQIRAAFAQTLTAFGRLDVLFNNAGVGAPRIPMEDLKLEDWKRALDVNLTGSFVCAQEAIKIMKDQVPMGGRIINNGSISSHSPRPHTVAYTATKHAMTGLTKSIALDGRAYDISCSQIDIGNADTPLGARFKEGVQQANGEILGEGVMDPKHCGEVVAYIAGLPKEANILFTTIMATKMPFVGRA